MPNLLFATNANLHSPCRVNVSTTALVPVISSSGNAGCPGAVISVAGAIQDTDASSPPPSPISWATDIARSNNTWFNNGLSYVRSFLRAPISCSRLFFHSLFLLQEISENTGSAAPASAQDPMLQRWYVCFSLKHIAHHNRQHIGAMAGFSSVTQFLLAIVGPCSIIPVTFPSM